MTKPTSSDHRPPLNLPLSIALVALVVAGNATLLFWPRPALVSAPVVVDGGKPVQPLPVAQPPTTDVKPVIPAVIVAPTIPPKPPELPAVVIESSGEYQYARPAPGPPVARPARG